MKYAITLASFRQIEPLQTTLEKLSGLGFDALEMYGEPGTGRFRKLADLFGSYQFRICGVTGVWGAANSGGQNRILLTSNRALQKQAQAYVKDCIKMCQFLGGRHLNVCLFSDKNLSTYERTHRIVSLAKKRKILQAATARLRDLARFASDYGVHLVLEPLNRYSTIYCSTAQDARFIVDRVDHNNFKMMLDTFHMNIEEDSIEKTIYESRKTLAHVHFADNNRKMPGQGHINFAKIMQRLKIIKYDGFATFEPTMAGSGYRQLIKEGLEYIRSLDA